MIHSPSWDVLFGSYSVDSADPLAIAFAGKLVKTYPRAEVILVERDIDAWYIIVNKAIIESSLSPYLNLFGDFDPWI